MEKKRKRGPKRKSQRSRKKVPLTAQMMNVMNERKIVQIQNE